MGNISLLLDALRDRTSSQVRDFLIEYAQRRYEDGARNYALALLRWTAFLNGREKGIEQATQTDAQAYEESIIQLHGPRGPRGVSGSNTVNSLISVLRCAYRELNRAGMVRSNPFPSGRRRRRRDAGRSPQVIGALGGLYDGDGDDLVGGLKKVHRTMLTDFRAHPSSLPRPTRLGRNLESGRFVASLDDAGRVYPYWGVGARLWRRWKRNGLPVVFTHRAFSILLQCIGRFTFNEDSPKTNAGLQRMWIAVLTNWKERGTIRVRRADRAK